jgi:hypothetical protein
MHAELQIHFIREAVSTLRRCTDLPNRTMEAILVLETCFGSRSRPKRPTNFILTVSAAPFKFSGHSTRIVYSWTVAPDKPAPPAASRFLASSAPTHFRPMPMTLPVTHTVQTPFDSVENAQTYVQLLIETLVEAKKEIAADAASATSVRSDRRLQALRLVEYKLHRLEHHLTTSNRMLNDLRRLRRLLLDEASDLT